MSSVFDYVRRRRIGLPESIYCEGKDLKSLRGLLDEILRKKAGPVLLTRLSENKFKALRPAYHDVLDYDEWSRTAFFNGILPKQFGGSVAVVTAGTSDLSVAREAVRTLEYLGISNKLYPDIGVAGLWRLKKNVAKINRHNVVIAVAGMDAALVSVLGGLTPRPVIAVPTSVGYGASRKGITAFCTMLTSCAPGILVTNIDNGYGAACAACRILKIGAQKTEDRGRKTESRRQKKINRLNNG